MYIKHRCELNKCCHSIIRVNNVAIGFYPAYQHHRDHTCRVISSNLPCFTLVQIKMLPREKNRYPRILHPDEPGYPRVISENIHNNYNNYNNH